MSNIQYKCALFTNPRKGSNDPQLTGHITVPVSRIDELISLLQNARVFQDRDEATVRIPLAFWSADPKSAPLVLSGKSSFMATASTMPTVDATPSF